MSSVTQRFAAQSAEVAPSLAPILGEHVAFYDELLAHVYFGEVSEWATNQVARTGTTSDLAAILEWLEASYPVAHEDVQNLIDVSFVENVQDDPAVVRLFGPVLLSRVDPEYQPK